MPIGEARPTRPCPSARPRAGGIAPPPGPARTAAASAGVLAEDDARVPGSPAAACTSRPCHSSTCELSSRASGATSSAAAEGVGARRSATKSAMVKSVSWPTALITGAAEAAMARATRSSLKAHRSSSEPPPRATMMTSMLPRRFSAASAATICCGRLQALHGGRRQDQLGQRVAPPEDVHDVAQHRARGRGDHADAPREAGQRPLARGVKEPLGLQAPLQLLVGLVEQAHTLRLDQVDLELVLAARLIDGDAAVQQPRRRRPAAGTARATAYERHSTQRSEAPASLTVK